MKTYVILRRAAWRAGDELRKAAERSAVQAERMPDDVRWIRSYVLGEVDGSVGTLCVYEATSPEAVRLHSERAGLPVDEIVGVAETIVTHPDPAPVVV